METMEVLRKLQVVELQLFPLLEEVLEDMVLLLAHWVAQAEVEVLQEVAAPVRRVKEVREVQELQVIRHFGLAVAEVVPVVRAQHHNPQRLVRVVQV
jgi:hypothetical protein